MDKLQMQSRFLAKLGNTLDVIDMFEHVPNAFVFVKNAKGEFMAANAATCLRCGVNDVASLIGSTDAHYLPAEVARAYREDDLRVINSGEPIHDRLELFYDEQRRLDWFTTTKLPLRGRSGKVIGVFGMTRRDDKRMGREDTHDVLEAMKFARTNCFRVCTTEEMAEAIGISERNLHRKLKESLGVSPYELMLRERVQSAAQALVQTSESISAIAHSHGFCDQSAFTQQFRRRTGLTPREFRKNFAT